MTGFRARSWNLRTFPRIQVFRVVVCATFAAGVGGGCASTQTMSDERTSDETEALVSGYETHAEELQAELDQLMYSTQGESICVEACSLRDNICDLSLMICNISARYPARPAALLRCSEAGESCNEADLEVVDRCFCHYYRDQERTQSI